MRVQTLVIAILTVGVVCGGCPPERFDHALPLTANEWDGIINDSSLSGPDLRARLEADFPELSSLTLDALLQDKPLANQGGGDARSAYEKVILPNLLALTPDEIQIYATTASDVDAELGLGSYTDEEARLTVRFFETFDISSPAALEAYIDSGRAVWQTIPENMPTLFIDFPPEDILASL